MNHATNLKLLLWVPLFVILVVVNSCSVGDDTPPAPIEDLSFDPTTRQLNWTATGDDGNEGTATIYDLRFSLDPTVADDFSNATHIEDLPRPEPAGTPQNFLIPRLDVTGTQEFFFALDVRDEVGENSGPSNVVEVTTPLVSAEFQSSASGSCFGDAIGSGDFNGDLINDIVIGDPCLGMVFVFFGSNDLAEGVFDVSSADVTIIGNAGDSFGASVAGIGNFEGERADELAIGAPGFDGERGEVFIIFGSVNFPATIDLITGAPDRLITGESMGDKFGTAIVGLVGVEGGGTVWVLIGAPGANSGKGRAYLFRSDDIGSNTSASQARAIFIGQAGDIFGSAVAQTGNLDGDSSSDFAVGAPGTGRVYAIFGNNNISGTKDLSVPADRSGVVIIQGNSADGFGSTISGGGDIDGDGSPDLLVGAPGSNMDTGSVFLYSGTAISTARESGGSPNFETEFTGESSGNNFGTSVSGLGDINPEIGRLERPEFFILLLTPTNPDFAVGAPGTSEGGTVYVFFGRNDFPSSVPAVEADISLNGMNEDFPADEGFGSIVVGVGDITGDFINDFAAAGLGFVRAEF